MRYIKAPKIKDLKELEKMNLQPGQWIQLMPGNLMSRFSHFHKGVAWIAHPRPGRKSNFGLMRQRHREQTTVLATWPESTLENTLSALTKISYDR